MFGSRKLGRLNDHRMAMPLGPVFPQARSPPGAHHSDAAEICILEKRHVNFFKPAKNLPVCSVGCKRGMKKVRNLGHMSPDDNQ